MKALFLDRDGTLIIDKHYLHDPAGVELIPGVIEALLHVRKLGYALYLLTNQSGVGRGYYALEDVVRCNERMEELIGFGFPLFAGICIAPEAPDQPSVYRKPSPRFILESIERDGLDPEQCWMVGDREADIDAGRNASIRSAALCTGKLTRAAWNSLPEYRDIPVFDDFPAFAKTLT